MSTKGLKYSEESKARMSEAQKERFAQTPFSAETRIKMKETGKANSLATSIRMKEQAKDPEWIQRVSDGTKKRMHDPKIRARHLEAIAATYARTPNGSNFSGGNGHAPNKLEQFYALIFLPLGYLHNHTVKYAPGPGEQYRLDFALIESKVDIEIDGSSHKGSVHQEHDRIRDMRLRELGWRIIRINHVRD